MGKLATPNRKLISRRGLLRAASLAAPALLLRKAEAQFGACLPAFCTGIPLGGDPFFNFVVLLMPFQGANGSITAPGMLDFSPHAHGVASVVASAAISTAQTQFLGGSSLHCVGGGIEYADSTDWIISSANSDQYTLETWAFYNTLNGVLISQTNNIPNLGWIWQGVGSEIQFAASADGSSGSVNTITSGAGITTGAGFVLATDKDATGTIRQYVGGIMKSKVTPANSAYFHSPFDLAIGETSTGGNVMDGWIGGTRITKGKARFASDGGYTPSLVPFPLF